MIATAHHEPDRCFTETADGTVTVSVHADWLVGPFACSSCSLLTAHCSLLTAHCSLLIVIIWPRSNHHLSPNLLTSFSHTAVLCQAPEIAVWPILRLLCLFAHDCPCPRGVTATPIRCCLCRSGVVPLPACNRFEVSEPRFITRACCFFRL